MKCSMVEPWLVDVARGVSLDAATLERVRDHVRQCRGCAARLERERAISAALHRVAEAMEPPSWPPSAEAALLDAFDRARAEPRRSRVWTAYAAAAAVLAVAAALAWTRPPAAAPNQNPAPPPAARGIVPSISAANAGTRDASAKRKPNRAASSRASRPPAARPEFISWPGASELPAFESGHLMRVDLPASMALSLGLVRSADTAVVQADVLIGQDGFARAVRLAP
jgi:hypothetical protein